MYGAVLLSASRRVMSVHAQMHSCLQWCLASLASSSRSPPATHSFIPLLNALPFLQTRYLAWLSLYACVIWLATSKTSPNRQTYSTLMSLDPTPRARIQTKWWLLRAGSRSWVSSPATCNQCPPLSCFVRLLLKTITTPCLLKLQPTLHYCFF